ncbi:AAA family ATPase [bacterium]|nr:AAA family ATPase [bacterium]
MSHLIVVAGAPGSGKSTICKQLHERFQSVYIDFGWLREFHLDPEWKKASPVEEKIAFDNLVFILKNYIRHGYNHILVTDLQDERVQQIPDLFADEKFTIITLLVQDEDEHRRRVLEPARDSGYRNDTAAIAWNRSINERPTLPNEIKFDNTALTPEEAVRQIEQLVIGDW